MGGTAGPVARSQVMRNGPHGEKGPVIAGHARKGPASYEHAQKGQTTVYVKTTCPVCARSQTAENFSDNIVTCMCSANGKRDIATMDIGDIITTARNTMQYSATPVLMPNTDTTKEKCQDVRRSSRIRAAPEKLIVGDPSEPSFRYSGQRRPKRGGRR